MLHWLANSAAKNIFVRHCNYLAPFSSYFMFKKIVTLKSSH